MIEGHVRLFGFGIDTYDNLSNLMFYSVNMPIFFFVSGFLAFKEKLSTSEIWKRLWQKFSFLVIPAIVFRLFSDLLHGQNPLHVLSDGFGGYWFTITLFECFLIYYLVISLVKRNEIQMLILSVIALFGLVLLSLYGKVGVALVDLNHLTKYFQFFVFGLLAMQYRSLFEKTMRNEWIKALVALSFFTLLVVVNNPIWPSPVFHLLRDLVLRYLGTFIVVSWFVCNAERFNKDTRINNVILKIGQCSLAIYLLQYFFMPNFMAFPDWVSGIDEVTIHVISFGYTFIITTICMLFISLLSNSRAVGKYALGIRK